MKQIKRYNKKLKNIYGGGFATKLYSSSLGCSLIGNLVLNVIELICNLAGVGSSNTTQNTNTYHPSQKEIYTKLSLYPSRTTFGVFM